MTDGRTATHPRKMDTFYKCFNTLWRLVIVRFVALVIVGIWLSLAFCLGYMSANVKPQNILNKDGCVSLINPLSENYCYRIKDMELSCLHALVALITPKKPAKTCFRLTVWVCWVTIISTPNPIPPVRAVFAHWGGETVVRGLIISSSSDQTGCLIAVVDMVPHVVATSSESCKWRALWGLPVVKRRGLPFSQALMMLKCNALWGCRTSVPMQQSSFVFCIRRYFMSNFNLLYFRIFIPGIHLSSK